MKETRVTDGATLRHSRVMAMLSFLKDVDGGTTKDVQSFMFMNFGMKFKTASEMLYECQMAGSLVLSQDGRWLIAKEFKKYLR